MLVLAVNPDIVDSESSSDEVVREGDNVTLRCVAKGIPEPTVYWKREDGQPLILADGTEGRYTDPFFLYILGCATM